MILRTWAPGRPPVKPTAGQTREGAGLTGRTVVANEGRVAGLITVFDAHLHIVDPRFPLVANQGFVPEPFTCDDYRRRTAGFNVIGGAVVAGSFQGDDQAWLLDAWSSCFWPSCRRLPRSPPCDRRWTWLARSPAVGACASHAPKYARRT